LPAVTCRRVAQRRAHGQDGRRLRGRRARGGEDGPLQALLAQTAGRDLRHRGVQQHWQERHRPARGDERAEHETVVAAMAHVRLEAAEPVADVADDRVEAGPGVPAGPGGRLAGPDPDGPAPRNRRMLGVQREQDVLAEEIATVDVAPARDRHRVVLDADDEVHGARAQVLERRHGLALHDLDLEVGRARREPLQHPQQQRERGGLHERHPQEPARRVAQPRELGADRVVGGERLPGVAGQSFASRCQLDVAADPAQEPRAGLALELGELDGYRRRAVGERLGDRGDRAEPGQRLEQA